MSNCCASRTLFSRLRSHTEQGAEIAFQRHHLLSSFLGVQHHCFPVEEESKRTMVCLPQTSCQDGNCPFRVQLTDQLDGKTYCSALGKRSHVPLGPVSGMQAQLREHMEKAFHPMWGFFLGQCKLGRIGGWYSPEIQCQEAKEWDSLPHFYGIWWVKGTVLHPWGIKRWIRHSR